MTFLDIARRLDAEATKGPWWDESDRDSAEVVGQGLHGMERPVAAAPHGGEKDEANMALIAFTRSTLPEVAALVEAANALRRAASRAVDDARWGEDPDSTPTNRKDLVACVSDDAMNAVREAAEKYDRALTALDAKAASLGGAK